MRADELYKIAESEGIEIMSADLPLTGSMSLMTDDLKCYIGLDRNGFTSSKEEKERLAHEIGHCVKGAFYNRYSKLDIKSKHEYSADKWACEALISKAEMQQAFDKGFVEVWQLAEYFDVTERLIKKALWIYFDKEIE